MISNLFTIITITNNENFGPKVLGTRKVMLTFREELLFHSCVFRISHNTRVIMLNPIMTHFNLMGKL